MPTISVEADVDAWQDTSLVVGVGRPLIVSASGTANPNVPPFGNGPEGGSPLVPEDEGEYPAAFDLCAAYGLALLVIPDGDTPPNPPSLGGPHLTNKVIGPGAAHTYSASDLLAAAGTPGPYRIWARMNDNDTSDNDGSWSLTVTEGAAVAAPVLDSAVGSLVSNIPQVLVSGH